jgi:hypothetical protein
MSTDIKIETPETEETYDALRESLPIIPDMYWNLNRYIKFCDKMANEFLQFKAKLDKYGGHLYNCPLHDKLGNMNSCICGWADIQKARMKT